MTSLESWHKLSAIQVSSFAYMQIVLYTLVRWLWWHEQWRSKTLLVENFALEGRGLLPMIRLRIPLKSTVFFCKLFEKDEHKQKKRPGMAIFNISSWNVSNFRFRRRKDVKTISKFCANADLVFEQLFQLFWRNWFQFNRFYIKWVMKWSSNT